MNDLRGKTVLVVDDDLDLLNLIEFVFCRVGCQVYTALNGTTALRQFDVHQPDLIILDLIMPQMDGWEVCRRIRELSNVPLIMLSALGQRDQIVRGLDSGADDYLVKPFDIDILLARARALLRRAALPSTQKERPPMAVAT